MRVNRVYERLAARRNARGTPFHSPNRVYERVAARRNGTYKGIRIQRTSYVVYEFIRSTSYVASSSTLEC